MRVSLNTIKAVSSVAKCIRKEKDIKKKRAIEDINIIFGFKFLETYRLLEVRRELNYLPAMMASKLSKSKFAHLMFLVEHIIIELDKEVQIREDRDLL